LKDRNKAGYSREKFPLGADLETEAKTGSRLAAALALCVTVLAGAYLFTRAPTPPPQTPAKKAEAPALPQGVAALVTLDDDDQERGGIVVETPAETEQQPRVRAYGLIKPLDGLTTLFNAIGAANWRLKAAEIKRDAARVAFSRAGALQKVMPSAASQAEAAEAALNVESANVETARAQVGALRAQAIQDWGAVLGEAAAAQSQLAEDLVLRKAALLQLTTRDDIPPPPRVTLAIGGESVEARLLSPAPQADARLAGASHFYVVQKPAVPTGASVLAWLPQGQPRRIVAIKPSAVVWQAGKPWIYLKTGADRFERKFVEGAAPMPDGGYAAPADSWPRGQALVVEGAQALLAEEAKARPRADEDDD
jgi:hypothetical protein